MKKLWNKDKNMEVDHKDIIRLIRFIVDLSWERNRKKDRNITWYKTARIKKGNGT